MPMIDSVTLALVKSALDAGALRQVAHANNIANANTPGYKPLAVSFEERLSAAREAVGAGNASQLSSADIPVAVMYTDTAVTALPGMDSEVASASKNALHYQALTRVLSHQYGLMNLALSNGSN